LVYDYWAFCRFSLEVAQPNKKTAGSTDGPFVDMSLGLMRSTLPLAF
jgi:hypothetical protein